MKVDIKLTSIVLATAIFGIVGIMIIILIGFPIGVLLQTYGVITKSVNHLGNLEVKDVI